MDYCDLNRFDIFEIYRRYCEITLGRYLCGKEAYRPDDDSQKAKVSRVALDQLLKLLESRVHTRMYIFDEVLKLMSRLDLMFEVYPPQASSGVLYMPLVDHQFRACVGFLSTRAGWDSHVLGGFSEFSRFYDFVFFICREDGQKNITVSRAVTAWRLILAGRFRLLNEWCDFVEKNQRHNISEDTWRQVLPFSRCVHENLVGYDPEGAWPVLIDDFVEHMYRITGSNDASNLVRECGDSEPQSFEDPLPGLKVCSGLKRKLAEDVEEQLELSERIANSNIFLPSKRRHVHSTDKFGDHVGNTPGNVTDECMEIVKPNTSSGCSKSPCAVEGCLTRGFAGLFSGRSCLQFDPRGRVSYT